MKIKFDSSFTSGGRLVNNYTVNSALPNHSFCPVWLSLYTPTRVDHYFFDNRRDCAKFIIKNSNFIHNFDDLAIYDMNRPAGRRLFVKALPLDEFLKTIK